MVVATSFLSTEDDVRLAWAEIGAGEPIVFERGWITHVELGWEDLAFRDFLEALARYARVIRYDHRGMGLSDRDVPTPDLGTLLRDLEALIDHLGLERTVLWGSCFGGPVAIRYAARHPERVSKLIIDDSWARPTDLQVNRDVAEITTTMLERMGAADEPRLAYNHYLRAASSLTDAAPVTEHQDRVERASRAIGPETLAQLYLSIGTMNVEADASEVDAPTLVLHRRGCWLPMKAGQRLASLIRGATFVGLDGESINLWEDEAAVPLQAIVDFLDLPAVDLPGSPSGRIIVLLMTDLVDSTAVTTRLGDERAEPLQRFHDQTVRGAMSRHRGHEISHTGDGILARFSSAADAIRCGLQIQEGFARRNAEQDVPLDVRIGLNAGEPIGDRSEMFGAAVNKVARVCAAASGREILVTPVVQALVEGKGFVFEDRGEHRLKGFADPVRLHAVSGSRASA